MIRIERNRVEWDRGVQQPQIQTSTFAIANTPYRSNENDFVKVEANRDDEEGGMHGIEPEKLSIFR